MDAIFFEPPLEDNYLGHQFAEIYKERIYEPYLRGKSGLTIIDVGANVGLASYYFSQFASQVHAFEPAFAQYQCLTTMLKNNHVENVVAHNKAIWIDDVTLPLYHNKNKTMNSLHMAVNDGSSEPEQVACVRLDTFLTSSKIDHVDLLKIDIEGSEIEVFSSDSFKAVADKIDLIVTERHAWAGRNPNQLNEALRNNGFKVETIPNDADILVAKKGG